MIKRSPHRYNKKERNQEINRKNKKLKYFFYKKIIDNPLHDELKQ